MLQGMHKIHLIGIGGAGMRAIAKILILKGFSVTGSDVNNSPIIEEFRSLGATITIGHSPEAVEGVDAVVVSTAIPESNCELKRARELSIPVLHRSHIVAAIVEDTKGIAVAGTHGKTTTTSMLGQIFEEAQWDPTIVIGGEVDYLKGNSKLGKGPYSVVEADESDGSFISLNPKIEIITNIEKDHMDYYKTLDKLLETFNQFVEKLPDDGKAVVCGDNTYIKDIVNKKKRSFVTYGFHKENDYVAKNVSYNKDIITFTIWKGQEQVATIALHKPGLHNVLNATAAFIVAYEEGVAKEVIYRALAKFSGAKRRFETKGITKGVWVVDDYAHHPTEIKATLGAAKSLEEHRIICCFQPHRYSRTQLLLTDFGEAFSEADIIVMTDIYSAGEAPLPGIDGLSIPNEIKAKTGKEVVFIKDIKDVPSYIASIAQDNDLVITMGAGTINQYGPKILTLLEEVGHEK